MISTYTNNIMATATNYVANASETAVASTVNQLPPPGEEIFDIVGSVGMAYPWSDQLIKILLWVIALIFVIWFYRWLITPVERKRRIIKQNPSVQAQRAIKRLMLSDIWQNRNIKVICGYCTAILKNYAHDEYAISSGASSTSDEFIQALINGKVKNEVLSKVRDLLTYSDEVCYMGIANNKMSQEELVNLLESIINIRGWVA